MNPRTHTDNNSKGIFAIHGGGNIGLGLMADVASQSEFNYQIVATSNDVFLKNIVNSANQLWLQHSSDTNHVTHIKNITIVSRNDEDVIKLYKEASILAICLTPGAMLSSANLIAQGLIERHRNNSNDLKVFVLMNLPDGAEVVRKKVTLAIFSLLNNPKEARKVCESVKFIPTVVDRIVTKISENNIKEQLKRHLLASFSMDFIDLDCLNRQVSILLDEPRKLAEAVKKFNLQFSLFNAEKNYALYAPSQIPEVLHFPAMKPVGNLIQLEAIKNKYINGPHAMIAWLGALVGCKTIASAINYPGMKQFIETTMDREIAPALMVEYPNLTSEELFFFKQLFLQRCEASTDDPVERVGRDPLRKINAGERVKGTIEIRQHHHLNIPMHGLEYGISAAILYAVKKLDPTNVECQKICEIYDKNKSYKEVLYYHGAYSSGNFQGLDPSHDATLMKNILNQIATLETLYETEKANRKSLSLPKKSESSTLQFLQQLSAKQTPIKSIKKTSVAVAKSINYVKVPKPEVFPLASQCQNSLLTSLSFLTNQDVLTKEVTLKIASTLNTYSNRG